MNLRLIAIKHFLLKMLNDSKEDMKNEYKQIKNFKGAIISFDTNLKSLMSLI